MNYQQLTEAERITLNTSMFKAYDIRTKSEHVSKELSIRLLEAIARYYHEILSVDTLVLGRDARLAAPRLMEEALEIFPAFGLDVIVNPLQSSTCQFYFSCMQHPSAGGIMFTASHNPGEYIGLKLVAPPLQALALGAGPKGGIAAIRDFYAAGSNKPSAKTRGRVYIRRYLDRFIEYSRSLAGVDDATLKGVPIMVDFLSGAAGTEVAEALMRSGAELSVRNLVPDGTFPAGEPNPIAYESLRPTTELMKKGNWAFGFAFDGDGDRMDLMDRHGEQVPPSFNLSILIPEVRAYFESVHARGYWGSAPFDPQMFYDVKANPLSIVLQAKAGMGVHIIRNGHSFIKEALRKNLGDQYVLASEESAHYYMNFPYDLSDPSKGFASTENTLFFALLTARMYSRYPEKYEQAMKLQDSIHRRREWPCHFFDDKHLKPVVSEVERIFSDRGLTVFKEMEDGSSLDATLMRKGLPLKIDASSDLKGSWLQVAQRISRSEEGIARWEVASSTKEGLEEAVGPIMAVTDRYVDQGEAEYV